MRRTSPGSRVVPMLVAAIASACGRESEPVTAIAVVGRDGEAVAPVRFADGAVVHATIEPDPVDPDADVRIAIFDEGAPADWTITAWPPSIGGRELVLGSDVSEKDAARPDDPRVVSTTVPSGTAEVVLRLPAAWHPTTVMITVARSIAGAPVLAILGPRTRDGLGVLGLARVQTRPAVVQAMHVAAAPTIDGVLEDAAWTEAAWVELGDSLDGEPQAPRTRLAFAWDDVALYVAADFADDDVWSSFVAPDDPIWKEEAFELFLLGTADRKRYLELQVSPRGVTFDARFERYRNGDEGWDGAWTAAVAVVGTLDARDDRDRGWTTELAVPWAEICAHTDTACPPRAGARTRVNAFRLDRPRRGSPLAWALSPTREPDFHAPENAAILELLP